MKHKFNNCYSNNYIQLDMLVKVSSNDIRSSDAKGKIFSSGTANFRPKSSTDLLLVLGDQHGSVMQQKGNSCRNALGMH